MLGVQSCLFPQRVGRKRSRCRISREKRGAEGQPVPALPALSPAGLQVRGDHELLLLCWKEAAQQEVSRLFWVMKRGWRGWAGLESGTQDVPVGGRALG